PPPSDVVIFTASANFFRTTSAPAPNRSTLERTEAGRLASRTTPPDAIVWTSVTSTTLWFGIFREALVAATFGARCFFVRDLRATPPARRIFDFTLFAAVRFAADLRSTLALALRRFKPFLRVAIFALAIAFSYRVCTQARNRPTTIALQ